MARSLLYQVSQLRAAALDGEMPSGDVQPGGHLMFALGSLVGDVDCSRRVRASDQAIVRDHLNVCDDIPSDINNSGCVRASDQALVRDNLNASLAALPACD